MLPPSPIILRGLPGFPPPTLGVSQVPPSPSPHFGGLLAIPLSLPHSGGSPRFPQVLPPTLVEVSQLPSSPILGVFQAPPSLPTLFLGSPMHPSFSLPFWGSPSSFCPHFGGLPSALPLWGSPICPPHFGGLSLVSPQTLSTPWGCRFIPGLLPGVPEPLSLSRGGAQGKVRVPRGGRGSGEGSEGGVPRAGGGCRGPPWCPYWNLRRSSPRRERGRMSGIHSMVNGVGSFCVGDVCPGGRGHGGVAAAGLGPEGTPCPGDTPSSRPWSPPTLWGLPFPLP